MNVVSILLDGLAYVIGDSELDFKLFGTSEEFFEFLNEVAKVSCLDAHAQSFYDAVNKGEPKMHPIDSIGLDVVEEESSAVMIASPEGEPIISLIHCSGPNALKWRDEGTSITMTEPGVIVEFESPRLKFVKATNWVSDTERSFH